MKIQTGRPIVEGRYVVFIRCAPSQVREWLEPIIMVWHGGRWQSTFMPQANVEGWCGPIPVMKVSDLPEPAPSYDL